jgi:SAM-dependent methyltransferase
LQEWLDWAGRNPSVYDAAAAEAVAERILVSGFVEPITGRRVEGRALSRRDRNWREGVVANGLCSRMRAVMHLMQGVIGRHAAADVRIFATEAVTPFALLMRGLYPRFLGSEYGLDHKARDALFPIPHQDLTALTLPSDTFDLVSTNEVLEHVSDLDAGLHEIARVLKPDGWHVGTHPFLFMSEKSDLRTKIVDGALVHLMPPEYHGNPVDAAGGSLVFETPAWDIIPRARAAGFRTASMRFVTSERHGYLTENMGVFVLCAQK